MPPPSASPSPFLKWVGGKRQLLPHILQAVPARLHTYYEPFVGGGAVFFALVAHGRAFDRAVLGDANEELVRCYRAIQRDVEGVIGALRRHRYDRDVYYRVRERDPERLSDAGRAARPHLSQSLRLQRALPRQSLGPLQRAVRPLQESRDL